MIKINDGREVINETVENLSIIAQEVHELQQCIPTEVNLQLYEEMRQNE